MERINKDLEDTMKLPDMVSKEYINHVVKINGEALVEADETISELNGTTRSQHKDIKMKNPTITEGNLKNDEDKYTDREKSLMRLHNQQLQMNEEAYQELAEENLKLKSALRKAETDYRDLMNTKTTLKKVQKLEREVESLDREKEWIIDTVKEFAKQLEKANG